MFTLTRDAAEAIKGLAAVPGAEGLRISTGPQSMNGSGPGLQAELAEAPELQDAVVEAEGARLFVAPEAAQVLDGKVLDADFEGQEVRFALLEQAEGEAGE